MVSSFLFIAAIVVVLGGVGGASQPIPGFNGRKINFNMEAKRKDENGTLLTAAFLRQIAPLPVSLTGDLFFWKPAEQEAVSRVALVPRGGGGDRQGEEKARKLVWNCGRER